MRAANKPLAVRNIHGRCQGVEDRRRAVDVHIAAHRVGLAAGDERGSAAHGVASGASGHEESSGDVAVSALGCLTFVDRFHVHDEARHV